MTGRELWAVLANLFLRDFSFWNNSEHFHSAVPFEWKITNLQNAVEPIEETAADATWPNTWPGQNITIFLGYLFVGAAMGEVTARLQPHLVYAAGLLQAWRMICILILMSFLPLVDCG